MTESFIDKLDPEQAAHLLELAQQSVPGATPVEAETSPSGALDQETLHLALDSVRFAKPATVEDVVLFTGGVLRPLASHIKRRGENYSLDGQEIDPMVAQEFITAAKRGVRAFVRSRDDQKADYAALRAKTFESLPKLAQNEAAELRDSSEEDPAISLSRYKDMLRRRTRLSAEVYKYLHSEALLLPGQPKIDPRPVQSKTAESADATAAAANTPDEAKPSETKTADSHVEPESPEPKRQASHRTLASIGGLAALNEVASLRNSKGVDHFYGFDDEGKMWHISRDKALEWYEGMGGKGLQDSARETARREAEQRMAAVRPELLTWLGVSGAEYVALSPDEMGEKWRQALARDAARREAEQKISATAVAATEPAAPTIMVSPPRRPSLWQRLKDAPNRWTVRSLEWARRHKAESLLGGVAVAAAVYGAIYALTRDHSAAHNALGGLPPSGGGSGHEAAQQTIGSGNTASTPATNKDLIDSLSGQSGSAGANADQTANKSLIDSLSGQGGGKPNSGVSKPLIDSLSGNGGGSASAEMPQDVKLSLTHSGDNIWSEVKDYMGQHNLPTDNWSVDFVKDRVLESNGLTEKLATNMHVGSTFTIPRAVLEELLKAKKS
jgi:hypothetical protein